LDRERYKLLLPGEESSLLLPWSEDLSRIIFSHLTLPKEVLSLGTITVANYLTGVSDEFTSKMNFIVMLRDVKAYDAARTWGKQLLSDSNLSNSQKADTYNVYGYVLYLSGKEYYPEAIDNYRLSIELGRNDGWPERNIARIFEEQEQSREAIKSYEKALKKAKKRFDILLDKYKAYRKSDEAAVEFFSPPSEKTKKLNFEFDKAFKELPGFYNALAWSIVTADKKQLAPGELKRANQLAGIGCQTSLEYHKIFSQKEYIDPNILDTYATSFAALGNFKEAIEHEKAAYQLSGEKEFLKKIKKWELQVKKKD
jgi:tetratricopeptide (TPR) repeat protein